MRLSKKLNQPVLGMQVLMILVQVMCMSRISKLLLTITLLKVKNPSKKSTKKSPTKSNKTKQTKQAKQSQK